MCGTSLQGDILDRFHQKLHDLEQQVTQGREAVKRVKQLATELARQHKQLSEQIATEDRSIVQTESTIKNGQEEAQRRLAASNQLSDEAHRRWAILQQRARHARSLLTSPTPECLTSARQQQAAIKASVKQRADLQTIQADFDVAVNRLQEMQRQRTYPVGTFTTTQLAGAQQAVLERQSDVAQARQDLIKAQKKERQLSDEIIGLQSTLKSEQTQIQHIEQEELPRARQSLGESEATLNNAKARFGAQISELNWPADQISGLRRAAAGDAHAHDTLKQWAGTHQAMANQLAALEKAERQIDQLRAQQGEIKKQIESYSQEARSIEPTAVEKQIGACQALRSQQQAAFASAQHRRWEETQRLARRLESEQQLRQLERDENNFRRLESLLAPPGRDSDGGPLRQQITRGLLLEVADKASSVLEDWGQSIEVVVPVDVLAFKVIDRATSNAERHFQLYSGGEKFLVALAMAISIGEVASATGHPDCLFIDEGFGLLDAENRARVAQEIVSRLVGSGRRKQVVVITHMEDIQSAFSARYHLINDGTATRLAGNEDDLS
jgi:DNA repair exonuclease SbcCD ATPase subunit